MWCPILLILPLEMMNFSRNLFVDGYPYTPTKCCLKHFLDSPNSSPSLSQAPPQSPLISPLTLLSSLLHFLLLLPLCVCQPPFHSSSLLFYSLSLVGIQIITFASVSRQFHFCLEFQGKMIPLKNSLETCS